MEKENNGNERIITTIKISKKTKERLENLRSYRRESYEEIMEKIFNVLNICRADPDKARLKLLIIDKEKRRNLEKEQGEEKEEGLEDEGYQVSMAHQKPKFHLRK